MIDLALWIVAAMFLCGLAGGALWLLWVLVEPYAPTQKGPKG